MELSPTVCGYRMKPPRIDLGYKYKVTSLLYLCSPCFTHSQHWQKAPVILVSHMQTDSHSQRVAQSGNAEVEAEQHSSRLLPTIKLSWKINFCILCKLKYAILSWPLYLSSAQFTVFSVCSLVLSQTYFVCLFICLYLFILFTSWFSYIHTLREWFSHIIGSREMQLCTRNQ